MLPIAVKYLVTAGVVVAVGEAARRGDRIGALVASLPSVTLLALVWMHLERQAPERIAAHAWYTFWYVVPTLPMFLAFPWMLPRIGFWPSLGLSVLLTAACLWGFGSLAGRWGIRLL